MMKINARKMALKMLNHIEQEKAFSHIVLNQYFEEYEIGEVDRRFISSLILGILENKLYVDYYIRRFSKIRFGKLNHEIVNILRIGIYQMLFMDKVPQSAAVNESVKLAKKLGSKQGNFVNGVLRAFTRDYQNVKLPDAQKHTADFLSIKYSHPLWLVKKWISAYGNVFTEALLKSNNAIPPLSIRVNTLKISREDYSKNLLEANIDFQLSDLVDEGIVINALNHVSVRDLPGFEEGHFQVQDQSSMLIAGIANPQEGDFVIDVCASPGGKTCHMAQLMKDHGKILARDLTHEKCQIIDENANRLGINSITTEMYDATHFDKKLTEKADVVLVDAPCSGLGIIRRKPDIKYNKSEEILAELSVIQQKILNESASYVRKGGTLIYSTCTINVDENEAVVNTFLDHHPQFELIDLSKEKIRGDKGPMITLYPHVHGTDGFFIAKMCKK